METNTIVHGLSVSTSSQCAHWHSDRDIVAIKHKCCNKFWACYNCHEAGADHTNQIWPKIEQNDTKAVLCGNCSHELTISEYLATGSQCTSCSALFNPRCSNHYHLYFEV
ncbi:hypothetical protein GYMLUDRAFT_204868 [Collybiopsis luxurians FD-317 M1]|uniref:Unplaced genomic scaffold GYMLUscaffold_50, whole genome shotgun sequence n=1 Tax=Collybiopsis luxurians FD-317 M1 TaxID=944289 RepID=A0A0D0CMK6_9AGAR|nr:hypothetical protein GYMLUDRAFT_204868 [Collybiopsis luxurians FD-317 M1]